MSWGFERGNEKVSETTQLGLLGNLKKKEQETQKKENWGGKRTSYYLNGNNSYFGGFQDRGERTCLTNKHILTQIYL